MEVIYLNNNQNSEAINLAIGNFDGVHKGHQELIKYGKSLGELSVLSFEPHPISYFIPERKNYRITPLEEKARLLKDAGVKKLFVAEFDRNFAEITAEDFIKNILVNKLKAKIVVTGKDFVFGKDRLGNFETLKKAAEKYGFKYTPQELLFINDKAKYSSTEIRKLISEGDISLAGDYLGRNYKISGVVVEGRKEGRKLGYKTANIDFKEFIIPKFGVYSCSINIEGEVYKAVANIGVRPTFNLDKPVLEVHIFNFDRDIYKKYVEVNFIKFIRDEKKFNSVEELKKQIEDDIKRVHNGFGLSDG